MAFEGKNPVKESMILNNKAADGVPNAPTGKIRIIQRNGTVFAQDDTGTESAFAGDVTAGSNFGADNRLIRSDGTAKGVQASGATLTDTDDLTVETIRASGLGTGVVHSDASGNFTSSQIVDADVDNGAAITDGKLATISTAGKVSANAITAGTMSGDRINSGTIQLADGSVGAVAYGFTSSANTGWYYSGGALFGSIAGTKRVELNGTFLELNAIQIRGKDGTAGSPGYTFTTSVDTGWYYSGGSLLGSVAGTKRFEMNGTFLELNAIQMRAKNGSGSATGYGFVGSSTSGWTYSSADSGTIHTYVNGTLAQTIKDGGRTSLFNLPVASDINISIDSAGELRKFSSSRRYKTAIEDLEIDSSKVFDLRPVSFDWKSNGVRDFGFIAEETHEILPELCHYNKDGSVEAVKYSQIAILLVPEVKKLKDELKEKSNQISNLQDQLAALTHMVESLKNK